MPWHGLQGRLHLPERLDILIPLKLLLCSSQVLLHRRPSSDVHPAPDAVSDAAPLACLALRAGVEVLFQSSTTGQTEQGLLRVRRATLEALERPGGNRGSRLTLARNVEGT